MTWMLYLFPLLLALTMAGSNSQRTATGSAVSSPRATRSAKTITVTPVDDGRTIHLILGDTLVLKLGQKEGWTVYVGNKRILAPSPRKPFRPGTQAVYSARAVGWTELVASANPPCTRHRPPCAVMAVGFRVVIFVDPAR